LKIKSYGVSAHGSTPEKGVNAVSWVLIRFMLILVPVVFFINGITKGNWLNAFLFAISISHFHPSFRQSLTY